MTTFNVFRYNLKRGFLLRYPYYLVLVLYVIFLFLFTMPLPNASSDIGVLDLLIYIFKGAFPYIPENKEPFTLPPFWCVLHLYIAFITNGYLARELSGFGQTAAVQMKSKGTWWFGKCIWSLFHTALIYFIIITATIGYLFVTTGSLQIMPHPEISAVLSSVRIAEHASLSDLLFHIIAVPFLSTWGISVLQLAVTVLINPVISMIVSGCIYVASVYFDTAFLIPNATMLIRNRFFGGTIDSWALVAVSAAVIMILSVPGYYLFQSQDYYKLKKEY